MSDRCYVEVTCRKGDARLFEEMGFKVSDKGLVPGTVVLVDYEADYGHCDDLPRDIPYYGWHGPGANYDSQAFACDGRRYLDAETLSNGFLVACVSNKGRLDKRMFHWVLKYQECLKRAKRELRKKCPARREEDG